VCFLSFLRRKLLFGWKVAQSSQHSDPFYRQVTLAFIRMMTSTCGLLCQYPLFACLIWREVLSQSIDHCIVCWSCCWAWCWMLQDMVHMEASWVFHVKVSTFVQLEQCRICVLTIILVGIVTLFVCHDVIVRLGFMLNPGYVWRQSAADDLSVVEFSFRINQTWGISCRSLQCIPANKQTNFIGPTYSKLQDHWNHLQLVPIGSRIYLE